MPDPPVQFPLDHVRHDHAIRFAVPRVFGLALLGVLDSVYLLLAKLGFIGGLSCTISHGCDMVNSSSYSEFLGVPVSAIGLAGYLALFVLAIVGIQPKWVDDPPHQTEG